MVKHPQLSFGAALLLVLSLLGCSGGGGDGGGGGGGGPVFVSLSYPAISSQVGRAVSAAPTVSGIPPGATPNYSASNLPPGLAINSSTGVVSGTPTAAGNYSFTVHLTVSGLGGQINAGVFAGIFNAPPYSWTLVSTSAPVFVKHELVALANTLYLIGAQRASPFAIQTWSSIDGGVTWTNAQTAPTAALRHFAVVSDGTNVFLSGGSDPASGVPTSQVWKFDGAAWSQVSVVTPFSARRRHAMVAAAGKLYVIGGVGNNGVNSELNEGTTGYLSDVWSTSDGGVNWTRLTAAAGFAPRFGHCAVAANGKLYVIGGYDGTKTLPAWESLDGATWNQASILPSPLSNPVNLTYSACAVEGGAIVVTGGAIFLENLGQVQPGGADSSIYRSTDGVNWVLTNITSAATGGNFWQRYAHGMTVLGTKLVLTGGRGGAGGIAPNPQETWVGQ
jgi:Putative Ig domain/Kelch motif